MNVSLAGIAEKNGAYFLALRKPGTTIGESWEFPGGKAEPGERYEQTLVREYMEEFSTPVTVSERIFAGSFANGDREFTLLAYKITINGDIRELPEHQKYGWFTPDQMDALKMADSDRMIADYLKTL